MVEIFLVSAKKSIIREAFEIIMNEEGETIESKSFCRVF